MIKRTIFPLIIVVFASFSFSEVTRLFSTQKVAAIITDNRLVEASGLEESYINPGYFWTHNDSGGEPKLYLIDTKGHIHMEVELDGVVNRDWEEIVTVSHGGKSFIYVAEIGDNKAVRDDISIIRLEEPKLVPNTTIKIANENLDIMPIAYAEGARDAEAVLFDRNTDEFVVITKREENSLVYSFPFVPGQHKVTVKSKGTIPARLFTAADMNEEGEILLKHYDAIYFWGESTMPAADRILKWDPVSVDYSPEPQGEAICWFQKNFYTLSEKNEGKRQEMLFFERLR